MPRQKLLPSVLAAESVDVRPVLVTGLVELVVRAAILQFLENAAQGVKLVGREALDVLPYLLLPNVVKERIRLRMPREGLSPRSARDRHRRFRRVRLLGTTIRDPLFDVGDVTVGDRRLSHRHPREMRSVERRLTAKRLD